MRDELADLQDDRLRDVGEDELPVGREKKKKKKEQRRTEYVWWSDS